MMAGVAEPGRTSTIPRPCGRHIRWHHRSIRRQRARGTRHQRVDARQPGHRHLDLSGEREHSRRDAVLRQPDHEADGAGAQLRCRLHALRHREEGQALVFCVLVLAALLGIASLVVDGGNALLQRRNQQGVADAAAMAAVKDLRGARVAADTAARTTRRRRTAQTRRSSTRSSSPGTTTAPATADSATRRSRPRASAWSFTRTHRASSAGSSGWTSGRRRTSDRTSLAGRRSRRLAAIRRARGAFTDDPPTQLDDHAGRRSRTTSAAQSTLRRGPTASSTAATRSSDVIKSASLRRRRRVPDRDRPIDPDADRRQHRQHHQQGLRRAHR